MDTATKLVVLIYLNVHSYPKQMKEYQSNMILKSLLSGVNFWVIVLNYPHKVTQNGEGEIRAVAQQKSATYHALPYP